MEKKFFWGVIERMRVFRKAPHLVPKVQGPPGSNINLKFKTMSNFITGSILFGKLITHTNKHDEEVTSSIVTIKQVDGSVSQVFAYANDIRNQDVIFCSKIPHETPLYEGGPNSEEGKDLLFEGTSSVQKLKTVNETLTVCKEFSL